MPTNMESKIWNSCLSLFQFKNISRMYARRCPSVLKTKEKSVRFAGASINFCCHATKGVFTWENSHRGEFHTGMTFWFRIAFTWWLGHFISCYLTVHFMLIKYTYGSKSQTWCMRYPFQSTGRPISHRNGWSFRVLFYTVTTDVDLPIGKQDCQEFFFSWGCSRKLKQMWQAIHIFLVVECFGSEM